jgi:SAM-dependent methyltransferase
MKSFENSYSSFYDLLYHDKNYKKEFNNIYKFIPKKDLTFNKILELGCGTGNFSNFFLSFKPSEILGIDSSKSMIEIAKNKHKNKKLIFKHINISNFKSKNKYDLIYSLFHVLSYQTKKNQIKKFFNITKKNLKKNGIFIFDFWNKNGVLNLKPSKRYKVVRTSKFDIHRFSEPEWFKSKDMVKIKYLMLVHDKKRNNRIKFSENHLVRYFNLNFIKKILKINNLKILKIFNSIHTNKSFSNSWALTFITMKV